MPASQGAPRPQKIAPIHEGVSLLHSFEFGTLNPAPWEATDSAVCHLLRWPF